MLTVLPFGLSTACFAFNELLRPLVKKWQSKGIRCLDDSVITVASYD